jgi:hypothetical protein
MGLFGSKGGKIVIEERPASKVWIGGRQVTIGETDYTYGVYDKDGNYVGGGAGQETDKQCIDDAKEGGLLSKLFG